VRAVGRDAPRLRGLVADRQLVDSVRRLDVHLDAQRRSVEADDLAVVAGAAGAAGETDVERLQEVRLAGAVGAVDDRKAGAQRDLGAVVGAHVADAQAAHQAHQTFKRMGMMR